LNLMPTEQIVALLIAERDKIDRAIQALGASNGKRRGRPPGSKNAHPAAGKEQAELVPTTTAAKTARKKWTPAQREEARARAKAMWARRKKAAKKAA
jgi:hypothetical protein